MTVEVLDLQFAGCSGMIAAFLVRSQGRALLVETGPASTLPVLVEELHRRGLAMSDLEAALITHVHLDHAGAAGHLAREGVPIYCHPRASRHLVDPSRLIAGARSIYGALFDSLWGETLAAPEAMVRVLLDGEAVKVGGVEVRAVDTPGHARHHHAYVIEGTCFAGDAAGVRLQGSEYLSVASAPPQFEKEPLLASLRRLEEAGAERLMLTHYGAVPEPTAHLRRYALRVEEVTTRMQGWVAEGCDREEILRRYEAAERGEAVAAGVSDAMWELHQRTNGTAMCGEGILMSLLRVE